MATKTISEQDVLRLLAETFAEPPENIRPDVTRDAIAGWDSMGALMLMAEFDERFSIELTAETSKKMQCVADVLAFLRQHGVLQN
jgi:acyl carrier protein